MISAEKEPTNLPIDDDHWQMLPSIGALLRMTFEQWYGDNIPRHAAGLAFYTLFAIAPLLLLSVEVMSLIYGRQTAETQLAAQIEQYVHSAEAAALTQTILENALPSSANWLVTIGIVIAFLYGASSIFGELQVMLNIIWGVHPINGGNFRDVIWQRIIAIIMVILSGLLIVVGLVITLWYSEATTWVRSYVDTSSRTDQLAYFCITLGLTALVFALIYKFVPAVEIAWHDVLIGAIATAFLVSMARLVITLYLSYNRIGSIYGAAGSLVILLLWVYYSAQIFFLGAEFTHVYSLTYGAHRRNEPTDGEALSTAPPKRRRNPLVRHHQENPTEGHTTQAVGVQAPAFAVKAEERAESAVEIEIINLNENNETISNREEVTEEPEANARKKQSRFGIPSLSLPELPIPSQLPRFGGPSLRGRWHALRSRVGRLVKLPLRLFRPIREFLMAVGVIGALSLAALFGFPWHRVRHLFSDQKESGDPQETAHGQQADEKDEPEKPQ